MRAPWGGWFLPGVRGKAAGVSTGWPMSGEYGEHGEDICDLCPARAMTRGSGYQGRKPVSVRRLKMNSPYSLSSLNGRQVIEKIENGEGLACRSILPCRGDILPILPIINRANATDSGKGRKGHKGL